MTCENCSAIFSRNECLHEKCVSHQEELAEFNRKVDNHIHAMVIRAWSGDNALGIQTPETDNNMILRNPLTYHRTHNAQTSWYIHPMKNKAVGDNPHSQNQKTFLAPTATSIDQGGLNTFRNPHTPPTLIHTDIRQVYEVK